MIRPYTPLFVLLGLLLGSAGIQAADPVITWPRGWEVEVLPQAGATAGSPSRVFRQRAAKYDKDGTPIIIMELTMTKIEAGHAVNLQGVLLEMRKSVQKDFVSGGYQSVCSKIHATTLSRLSAVETTCTITQNGRHVLSQTLVAAVDADKAYVLSYAGHAQAYAATQEEILAARNSLKL